MGKKSRKTKAKTKDFQKVKLKVGKRKPPANNVTETTFKSQAIYIPEQLKNVSVEEIAQQGELVNHRKQSVQDILNQTGHFSPNVRTDALTALKVHLSNHKHLIPTHLPKIIEKLPRLIVDHDQQVRRSCIAVFRLLFSTLSDKQISPFFDVIISHLHCAMSHIYEDVQRDSLQLVDLCVEFFPNLLTRNNWNLLLEHFIELISSKQNSTGAELKSGKRNEKAPARVLSMKLSNKESSITWRIKVLSRLEALLSIPEKEAKSEDSAEVHCVTDERFDCDGDNGIVVSWNSTEIGEILSKFQIKRLITPGISLRTNSMNVLSTLSSEGQMSSPWKLMTTIFPLLFDSWHEVLSDDKESLDSHTISTMVHVLNTVVLLCKKFIDSEDEKMEAITKIRSTFMKDFRQYFMSSFPFNHHGVSLREKKRKEKGKKQVDTDMQALQDNIQNVNLSVCELMTLLAVESELQNDGHALSSVATYVASLLLSEKQKIMEMSSLERIISTETQLLRLAADNGTIENLLRPLLLFSQSLQENNKLRPVIIRFFLKLYSKTQGKDEILQNNAVMVEWLCSLPDLLISVIVSRSKLKGHVSPGDHCVNEEDSGQRLVHLLLMCMRLACSRKNGEFLETLRSRINVLLSVLNTSAETLFCQSVEGATEGYCRHCAALQSRLFEVAVFYSPALSEEDFVMLTKLCHQTAISPKNVCYITEMVLRTVTSQSYTSESCHQMLMVYKFLSSVIIGISKEDLCSMQVAGDHHHHTDVHMCLKIPDICGESNAAFKRHNDIVTSVCRILRCVDHVSMFLPTFLCDRIMSRYETLPAHSVFAILESGSLLLGMDSLTETSREDLLSNLSKLCANTLIECHDVQRLDKSECVVDVLWKSVLSLFQNTQEIFEQCLGHLGTTDFSSHLISESVCVIIDKLVLTVELNEKLQHCQNQIIAILDKIKDTDAVTTQWCRTTLSNVSVVFRTGDE